MHPVFNLEHLRKYHQSDPALGKRTELPATRDYLRASEEYVVEAILGHKIKSKKTGTNVERDLPSAARLCYILPSNRRKTMGSKRYTKERKACAAGYLQMPSILSSMSFDLRHLPRITSHLVRSHGRLFKLWSPNSVQLPFLPDVFRADFYPAVPANPAEHRYDGHVGVHDRVYSPQYLRQDVGYWPFIRRSSQVTPGDYAEAAFVPLVPFWSDAGPSTLAGRLDPVFIDRMCALSVELQSQMLALRPLLSAMSTTWEHCPLFATVANIEMLRAVKYWDEAVDLGVSLQRNLREMEAWVAFVKQRKTALNLRGLRASTMDFADERYIGGWVNGTSEEVVLRYMHACVPCFIVHEYQTDELPREGVPTFLGFLQQTEVEWLVLDANPYQQIARRAGSDRRSSSVYLESLPRLAPAPSPTATSTSLSRSTVRSSAAGGPPENPSIRTPLARSSTAKVARTETGVDSSSTQQPTSSSSVGEPPQSSRENKFAARPLDRRTIEPDRVDWIVPPPIEEPNPNVKAWEHWELDDELYGTMMWTAVGKARAKELDYANKRYDRRLKRILHLGHYEPPPGVVLSNIPHFGEPVPEFPWVYPSGNRGIPKPASRWMYRDREGKRWEHGRQAVPPSAATLPLRNPRDASADTKGKAVATGEEDDDEEWQGPDVPEEGVVATSVITLEGVSREITARGFQEMAHDALFTTGAEPMSIVHGQGRMWVRFADVTGALRAFASLHGLAAGLQASWASTDEFDEATRYSCDVWHPRSSAEEVRMASMSQRDPEAMEVDEPAPPQSQGLTLPPSALPNDIAAESATDLGVSKSNLPHLRRWHDTHLVIRDLMQRKPSTQQVGRQRDRPRCLLQHHEPCELGRVVRAPRKEGGKNNSGNLACFREGLEVDSPGIRLRSPDNISLGLASL
ncbi:hypothetical protein C8R44DRAFT_867103 [Mycena epipterygia]|nr:hypothetical protein C8R44DRAFT_867103 [Mycena epipterygia]